MFFREAEKRHRRHRADLVSDLGTAIAIAFGSTAAKQTYNALSKED
jgi:hypothetical protein